MLAPRSLAVALFVLVLSACASVNPPVASDAEANPIASFGAMMPGEWRMAVDGGSPQFDVWRWGPGRHSAVSRTYGHLADGSPWASLDVWYWHPEREEVRLFGLTPDIPGIGRAVREGAMHFDGDDAARKEGERALGPPAKRPARGVSPPPPQT